MSNLITFSPGLAWDNSVGGSGPLPHSRYIGANAMCESTQTFKGDTFVTSADNWYWGEGDANVKDSTMARAYGNGSKGSTDGAAYGMRTLHPSSVLWGQKDEGVIIDNDHVGGLEVTPASEWCAEAVGVGNLEVWHAVLVGGKHAVALFNRSPHQSNITADWEMLGLASNATMAVTNVWKNSSLGKQVANKVTVSVNAHGIVLLLLVRNS